MFYLTKSESNTQMNKGQGLTEYALLLSLIAIVVIVALGFLRPQIGNVFSQISWSWDSEDVDNSLGADKAVEGLPENNEITAETKGSKLSKQITAILVFVIFIIAAVNFLPWVEKFINKRP